MDQALKRLENVTARLEAIEARSTSNAAGTASGNKDFSPPKFSVPLPGLATPPSSKQTSSQREAEGNTLANWDAAVHPALSSFLKVSEEIGGGVLLASRPLKDAFQAERTVIDAIAQCKRPGEDGLVSLVAPISAHLQTASAFTEDRRSPCFNHYKALAEALQSLCWVLYTGPSCGMSPPAQHIEEAWQSAEFYANKVLMEFRSKDPNHVAWVKGLKELLMGMRGHVLAHHKTGPQWNASGIPLSDFSPEARTQGIKRQTTGKPADSPSAKPRGPSKGPPPPPPPPVAGSMTKERTSQVQAPAGPDFSAVLSAISDKGEGVTSGLKRVTADMKTKNRVDRSGVVPASAPKASQPGSSRPPVTTRKVKPRTECEQGRKWVVENHDGQKDIVVSDTSPKQTVYIYKCDDSVIQIKGKVNAITIDQCVKTGVVFESTVASCELVNSSSLQVQVTGVVPTLAVDKCDGIQLFLSEASLGSSITTAKSSAINVLIPGKEGEDMVELYVPEQFISVIKKGTLVTEAVAHSG